jgi:hypothetical protein
MGKTFPSIDDSLRQFIHAQPVFFVGTAPLDSNGHINVSPKGLDTFRILGPTSIAYLDITGSGVETIAHLRENGRIVLMFCAFQGPPKILRIYGKGHAVEPQEPEFAELAGYFRPHEGTRAIVVVEVSRIADSCGYGVPLLRYEGERNQLSGWARNRGPEGLAKYRSIRNRKSIDGLPGLDSAVN